MIMYYEGFTERQEDPRQCFHVLCDTLHTIRHITVKNQQIFLRNLKVA